MKKILCVLLMMIMIMSFAACGKETGDNSKVTVYIPDTVTAYQGDAVYAVITYVFEADWQEKESFTVTMSGDTEKLGGTGTTVYSDKKMVQEVSNGATMELYYNDQGQQIKMVNRYADGGHREVIYTYDSKGRVISEEEKTYETADSEPAIATNTYSYVDTADGYTLTEGTESYSMVSTFNKNGQQLSQVTYSHGEELGRTEATYDAAGNMISQASYYNGEKQMEMKYTWKAVEVSAETAARFPQFLKGN